MKSGLNASIKMSSDPYRISSWSDFIGQEKMKSRLGVHIASSKSRDAKLPHILLSGPPGSGKTSMGAIIAQDMGEKFASFTMPIEERILFSVVQGLDGTVILFDELHRCSRMQQERLLTLIEDDYIQTKTGRRIPSVITVIGATTERDKIITPLFDRFTIKPDFEDYSDEDLGLIVAGMAKRIGLTLSTEEAQALGRASGGVPRNAKRLVAAHFDLVTVQGFAQVPQTLAMCQVNGEGMETAHLRIMRYLETNSSAGASVLASVLELPEGAVRQVEKLLFKKEYIQYAKSGRELTHKGFQWLRDNKR